MLLLTLSTAGFALAANAFLLPPEVTNEYKAAKNHAVPTLINPQSRDINLDCSGCPFALASQRNGFHEWTNSVESDLELKFTAEDDKLNLNGVPFYPTTLPFTPAPLSAKQSKKSGDEEASSHKGYDGDLRLSYSLEAHNVKGYSGPEQDVTATEITLSILGLDNEVARVDDIKIKTLTIPNPATGQQELFIVAVDTVPADTHSADAQCATILCRVMNKFRSTVHKVKTHAKTAAYRVKCICVKCMNAMRHGHHHPPHHPSSPNKAGKPMRLPTHNRVHPWRFNPHHHGHGQHHSWTHTFARAGRQIFSYVLLPILVGIIFGIVTSAIGMLVGHLIVAIWVRLRRSSDKNAAYERVGNEEKEDLPRYEDLEDSKIVADEKA